MIRHVFILALFAAHPSPPTRPPASAPAVESVERLVRGLGSAKYAEREEATRRLRAMGESALPALVPHLLDPDPEIASRVESLLVSPRDATVRTDMAVALLSTGDPDWMERGVYLLFEDPYQTCGLFMERTRGAAGLRGRIFEPVGKQLEQARRRWEACYERHVQLRKKSPAQADRELEMQKETDRYDAEAAYWMAYDAMMDRPDAAASQPAERSTSQPAAAPTP